MFARDIMMTNVVTVKPHTSVTAIARLLIDREISGVPVIDDKIHLVGIVSEGDLVHRVKGDHELPRPWWVKLFGDIDDTPHEYMKLHGRTAADVMTRVVLTVTENTSISEIVQIFEKKRIKRVPVVHPNGRLAGIVSRADVIQGLAAPREIRLAQISATDYEIRNKVYDQVSGHPWVNALTLAMVVNDGVVHLWGSVGSDDARTAVEIAAENVPGVRWVENNLGIRRYPPSAA